LVAPSVWLEVAAARAAAVAAAVAGVDSAPRETTVTIGMAVVGAAIAVGVATVACKSAVETLVPVATVEAAPAAASCKAMEPREAISEWEGKMCLLTVYSGRLAEVVASEAAAAEATSSSVAVVASVAAAARGALEASVGAVVASVAVIQQRDFRVAVVALEWAEQSSTTTAFCS
jgi:hypothetical protein